MRTVRAESWKRRALCLKESPRGERTVCGRELTLLLGRNGGRRELEPRYARE